MNKLNLFICLLGLILVSGCSKEHFQNNDKIELERLLTKIKTLAETSRCGNGIAIETIPIGEKACGGPSFYIVYTNTINVQELEKLAASYTELEKRYNQKWQVVSDCALVGGPRSVNCNNEKLEVIY